MAPGGLKRQRTTVAEHTLGGPLCEYIWQSSTVVNQTVNPTHEILVQAVQDLTPRERVAAMASVTYNVPPPKPKLGNTKKVAHWQAHDKVPFYYRK